MGVTVGGYKMNRFIDETGNKYGMLTVVERDNRPRKATKSKPKTYWMCECECGKITSVQAYNLRSGNTKSCGCIKRKSASRINVKHNMSRLDDGVIRPEFNAWVGMKTRCYNKNRPEYERYGGRGIKVCDRWLNSFENFYNDMGARPSPKHSIDRIDVNGDYEPSNCRWANDTIQSRNQRISKSNTTGFRGVSFSKTENRFLVTISANKQSVYIGKFKDLKSAIKARKEAETKFWK